MTPEPGKRLGPYELLSPIGAGGMGQVYRARDTRLGRDVAIKLLPSDTAHDPDRIRRFEQEARAASSIEHPAVLTVHDVGNEGGLRFLVTELLEGETVRARLTRAPLSANEVLSIASQLADGLAAAHARGVVHRDLKPENLFLTRDGRLKILDFGIARLTGETPAADGTVSDAGTSPGAILGTAGYMSPEQVRGLPTDARTDVFSLGAILFELATGRRAFPGDTAIDRALAIVREDPPPVGRADLPPLVDELIARCTAKNAEARTLSARDVARRLATPTEPHRAALEPVHTSGPSAPLVEPRPRGLRRAAALAGVATAWTLSVGGALWAGARLLAPPAEPTSLPEFQRITFTPGNISAARFAPDGKNVIYVRHEAGGGPRILTLMPGLPEARVLHDGLGLMGVSRQGELLVSQVDRRDPKQGVVLAGVPIGGGTPRRIRESAWSADAGPTGVEIAAVVGNSKGSVIEYPLGHELLRAEGWVSEVRVSPDGELVAFADHPHGNDDMGYVSVVDREGRARRLTPRFGSMSGLAWLPSGREIVFTAAKAGLGRALYYVDLEGNVRPGPRAPVDMMVLDVAPDGAVLLKREIMRIDVLGYRKDRASPIDLSWFDWGVPAGISDDGERYAFVEGGAAGGARYIAYVRRTDGTPPVRLGDGSVMTMSGSGEWVVLAPNDDRSRISLVPTELGLARTLDPGPITTYESATFMPGDRSLLIVGRDAEGQLRLYEQPLAPPGPPARTGVDAPLSALARVETSPDGREVIVSDDGVAMRRFVLATGEPGELPGVGRRDRLVRWTSNDRLLVLTTTTSTCRPCEDEGEPSWAELRQLENALRALPRGAPKPAELAQLGRRLEQQRRLRGAVDCEEECGPEPKQIEVALVAVDLRSGERTEVRRLLPEVRTRRRGEAIAGLAGTAFTRDGEGFVMSVKQFSSDLYIMRM